MPATNIKNPKTTLSFSVNVRFPVLLSPPPTALERSAAAARPRSLGTHITDQTLLSLIFFSLSLYFCPCTLLHIYNHLYIMQKNFCFTTISNVLSARQYIH